MPSEGIDQPRLEGIADAVKAAGHAHFSASYSDVALDEGHDRALCYRVPSAAFDDYILRTFAGQPIVMIDARFSEVTLNAVINKLAADEPYWAAQRIKLSIWGPNPEGGFADVSIAEPVTPQLQQQFTERYAPVPVHLQRGEVARV